MTVGELIERLSKINPNLRILGEDGGSGMVAPHLFVIVRDNETLSDSYFPALEDNPDLQGEGQHCIVGLDW